MKQHASSTASVGSSLAIRKPRALRKGARVGVFAPASPANETKIKAGLTELARLGFVADLRSRNSAEGYFAASAKERRAEFLRMLAEPNVDALIGLRGGYGSNYLLDEQVDDRLEQPKCLVGFSDLSSLQIFLWQRSGWVTFYGPMVAAGFEAGADAPGGYDEESFRAAMSRADSGWTIALRGESIVRGDAQGRLLGGALTLVEATIGTPWELDTRDTILVLEDRAMKPYQVDRVLMHFKQAGKFDGVRGIVLGDFPECEPPVAGSPTVRDVCVRILGELGVPIVFGAPVGHTARPMLTLPLGVLARLRASGEGMLEILEPAVLA
jgi:muramoyltetrapeptide carboxypeptidase